MDGRRGLVPSNFVEHVPGLYKPKFMYVVKVRPDPGMS